MLFVIAGFVEAGCHCRRLYSPSLKNVGLIEDAQLIFLIFHTFVCTLIFSRAAASTLPNLQTNEWKIRKLN